MKKSNEIGLNILVGFGMFLIIIGIWSLSKLVTMEEVMGEITHCSVRVGREGETYLYAEAKFFVDENEYDGFVNVNNRKNVGEKIKILYDPEDPAHFISKSSAYIGFYIILFGCVFFIPKYLDVQKKKKDCINEY